MLAYIQHTSATSNLKRQNAFCASTCQEKLKIRFGNISAKLCYLICLGFINVIVSQLK